MVNEGENMSEYFDQYGMMRMEKDTPVENGVLFTAYYRLFKKLNDGNYKPQYDSLAMKAIGWTMPRYAFLPNYFSDNPPNEPTRFSHDNMKGLYWLFKDQALSLGALPVFRWNGRIWWHPNGWMVFLAAKNKFFKFLFKPFIYFMIYWSVITSPKGDTSGNNLWFLCNDLIGYDFDFNKEETRQDFLTYVTNGGRYRNSDNPLRQLIEKW